MPYGPSFLKYGTPSHDGASGAADAFVDNNPDTYINNTAGNVFTAKYDLGAGVAKVANKYRVQIYYIYDGTNCPSSWTFEGSINDVDWTTLDTVSGETWSTDFQFKDYEISNTTAYRYYRLVMTLPDASQIMLGELSVMEEVNSSIGTARYAKVEILNNWGDASWVDMSKLWMCDRDGQRLNNPNMLHQAKDDTYTSKERPSGDWSSWTVGANFLPLWWIVDLGVLREIAHFKSMAVEGQPNTNMKDFILSLSPDGINWTPVLTAQTAHDEALQTFDILNPANLADLTANLKAVPLPYYRFLHYDYALAATYKEDSVTLVATRAGATITYNYTDVVDKVVASGVGETIPLPVGVTVVTITVVIAGQDTGTYTITVTRAALPLIGPVYVADQLSLKTEPEITNLAIGTGSPTAIGLGNEVCRRPVTMTRSGAVATYEADFSIGDQFSGPITEAALFATANDTSAMLIAKSFGPVTKELEDPLHVTWTVEFM